MNAEIIFLICGWVCWCSLHSVLIIPPISAALRNWLGRDRFYFRLFYNCIAVLTLVPMVAATGMMRGPVIFSWSGSWNVIRVMLLCCALYLFHGGSKQYDVGFFLGIRQIRERREPATLAADEQLSRRGVLGMTRHPWYLGSLLFIWTILSVYHQSSVIAAIVLSLYFVIGTLLEEQKLVAEYGVIYRNYQHEVSMLIPMKWLKNRMQRKDR